MRSPINRLVQNSRYLRCWSLIYKCFPDNTTSSINLPALLPLPDRDSQPHPRSVDLSWKYAAPSSHILVHLDITIVFSGQRSWHQSSLSVIGFKGHVIRPLHLEQSQFSLVKSCLTKPVEYACTKDSSVRALATAIQWNRGTICSVAPPWKLCDKINNWHTLVIAIVCLFCLVSVITGPLLAFFTAFTALCYMIVYSRVREGIAVFGMSPRIENARMSVFSMVIHVCI